MELVLRKVEKGAFAVFTLFQNKYVKPNSIKSHLLARFDKVLNINVWGIDSIVTSMNNY